MAAVGGDILEATFNHPTVGSGTFFFKTAEDSEWDFGGLRKNDDANGIDTGGAAIYEMTRTRWGISGTTRWDMNSAEEMEKLVALSESPVEADFTFTHVNGSVYGGKGTIVGDLKGSGKSATIPVKFGGGGKLAKV